MHASADWLPAGYKDWDVLLTEAVRRGMKDGKAPADVSKWAYGSWHVVDIEHPLAGFLPFVGRIAGTGPQPLSGDTTTVKQVGRAFGPSQRFTMDWSNIDGSTENIVLGESGNPYSAVLPRPVERLLQRHDLRASIQPGCGGRANTPHAAAAAMKSEGSGIRDQGSGDAASDSGVLGERRARWKRLIGPAVICLAAFVATSPQLFRGNSCGHDFDFHLVSWLDALTSWRHGIFYPHWAPSANYGAGEPRFVFYPPLTWMLGAALGIVLPWKGVPLALTFLLLAGTGLATRALARQVLAEGAGDAGWLRGAVFGLRAVHRVRALGFWRTGGRVLDSAAVAARLS